MSPAVIDSPIPHTPAHTLTHTLTHTPPPTPPVADLFDAAPSLANLPPQAISAEVLAEKYARLGAASNKSATGGVGGGVWVRVWVMGESITAVLMAGGSGLAHVWHFRALFRANRPQTRMNAGSRFKSRLWCHNIL